MTYSEDLQKENIKLKRELEDMKREMVRLENEAKIIFDYMLLVSMTNNDKITVDFIKESEARESWRKRFYGKVKPFSYIDKFKYSHSVFALCDKQITLYEAGLRGINLQADLSELRTVEVVEKMEEQAIENINIVKRK